MFFEKIKRVVVVYCLAHGMVFSKCFPYFYRSLCYSFVHMSTDLRKLILQYNQSTDSYQKA